MRYFEVKIETNKTGIEIISAALIGIGLENISIFDPDEIRFMIDNPGKTEWCDASQIEPVQDDVPNIKLYFDDTDEGIEKVNQVKNTISKIKVSLKNGLYGEGVSLGTLNITVTKDDDSEWKDKWKEFFKPKKVSDRIVVKPTWEEYTRQTDDELVLEIDPGMAFGTGTHETTSLCIRMLERYVKPHDSVLDIGTGSGILAISSALLGARKVLGIDIDEDAVRVANENIQLNGCQDACRALKGDLTKGISFEANIVVANLLADLVVMLSQSVRKHLKYGGFFIVSGILLEQRSHIENVLKEENLVLVDFAQDGQWCALVFELLD